MTIKRDWEKSLKDEKAIVVHFFLMSQSSSPYDKDRT
mgnify:CR=1 FL=1